MKREPIITVAGITSFVTAVIALVVSFGVPVTQGQSEAILGLVGVVAPWIVTVVRKYVTPNDKIPQTPQAPPAPTPEAPATE